MGVNSKQSIASAWTIVVVLSALLMGCGGGGGDGGGAASTGTNQAAAPRTLNETEASIKIASILFSASAASASFDLDRPSL